MVHFKCVGGFAAFVVMIVLALTSTCFAFPSSYSAVDMSNFLPCNSRTQQLVARQNMEHVPPTAAGLLKTSGTVYSPPNSSSFRLDVDGHLFNFTYDGIGGQDYHTTGVQVQITTMGMGEGYRPTGVPDTFAGYARTTQATIANIFPNAYQNGTTDFERQNNLFNRYEYQLQAPKIPQWQRDLPGYVVVIEFYKTPNDQDLVWSNVLYWPIKLVSSTPV